MEKGPITGLQDMHDRLADQDHDPSMSPEDYEDMQELEDQQRLRQRVAKPTKKMRKYV